jgi:hypothetical protein
MDRNYPIIAAVITCSAVACSSPDDDSQSQHGAAGAPGEEHPTGSIYAAGAADPCSPSVSTGYLNDELCLAPPPPELGFQLHFGPDDRADYDDPDALAPYILEPGAEDTVCQYRRTPNDQTRFAMQQHIRVRSGTHHLLIWGSPGETTDAAAPPEGTLVTGENCGARDGYLFQTGLQSALGDEGGVFDLPRPGAEVAPEDVGLARLIRPQASIVLEMHYVNPTSEPILREAWANTIYTDEADVTAVVDPIMLLGGLSMEVPALQTEVVPAGPCDGPPGPEEIRIMGINGHGHVHLTRLSAWIDRADGERQPIYETYDWAEPIIAQFSDGTVNPPLGEPMRDGAYSGLLTMGAGDRLSWECEFDNRLDQPLRWANEAYTAEMCNVFGYYTANQGLRSNGNWICITP